MAELAAADDGTGVTLTTVWYVAERGRGCLW